MPKWTRGAAVRVTWFAIATLPMMAAAAQPAPVRLAWADEGRGGSRAQLRSGSQLLCEQPAAVELFLLSDRSEVTQALTANYAGPATPLAGGGTTRTATIVSSAGSEFAVEDQFRQLPDGSVRISRVVTVRKAGGGDRAYGTGLEFTGPAGIPSLADAHIFIPGIWYATAANTPPRGILADRGQREFLIREDRMSLPLVSVRNPATGWTVCLTHESPDGGTVVADAAGGRVIDERLQFASLGVVRDSTATAGGVIVALRFPGTESERSFMGKGRTDPRPAERLHPVKGGAVQKYSVTVRASKLDSFPEQLREAWRTAWASASPQPVSPAEGGDIGKVYHASIGVLRHYSYEEGEVAGVPFSAGLPEGTVRDRSLQMGFVGQQLPCASYLIDEGLRSKDDALIQRGEKIVDFWARESFSEKGVPRTWFDVDPKHHFRKYDTFMRVVTDGASGMLRAWQIERAAKRDRPQWLAFCTRVGDWLVQVQNPDGSFYRSFDHDGNVTSKSTTNTLHPVRFLLDLSIVTGDGKYRTAATRAAEFTLAANTDGATYVGGTPDNPDVKDKEAGWIAMDSFLALYDVTGEKKWLDAAVAAANHTETWIYGWNVPLPPDSTHLAIPKIKTYAGAASLIATGHSGSDVFMAYASLAYARLAMYTGDAHFAEVARLLQANTAQLVDVDGSHGYVQPGLLVEAFSLAGNRGGSVRTWLPWGTSAILEPMARCREIFGTIEVAKALDLDPAGRDERNRQWGRTRGFSK